MKARRVGCGVVCRQRPDHRASGCSKRPIRYTAAPFWASPCGEKPCKNRLSGAHCRKNHV